MTIQLRMFVVLVPVLTLFTGVRTPARSLAAIGDSLTRSKIMRKTIDSTQKQIDDRHLEEFEGRTLVEPRTSMFGRIKHYAVTHKELLASDALLIGAFSVDAVSTVKCQHLSTPDFNCVEGNKLLGIHPSELTVWGYFTGLEAVYVAASHLLWHKHPDSLWRHISWGLPIAYSISEIPTVRINLETAPDNGQRL